LQCRLPLRLLRGENGLALSFGLTGDLGEALGFGLTRRFCRFGCETRG
jgi:hypothetical protein